MPIDPKALYLGDNGRAACGQHLGATARASGRDLSGQPIMLVTDCDARAEGVRIRCEKPGCSVEVGR